MTRTTTMMTTQTTEANATLEQSGWHRTLRRSVGDGAAIAFIVVILGGCALFFVADVLLSVLGLSFRPIPWAWIEYLEIGAAVGLTIGTVLGTLLLFRTLKGWNHANAQLRRTRSAFADHLAERFELWGLTPAEADVATFAIKGLKTHEIARLRQTSEGTVKAQCNAIYRKAGVSGRTQLLSVFIEDLMEDGPVGLTKGPSRSA